MYVLGNTLYAGAVIAPVTLRMNTLQHFSRLIVWRKSRPQLKPENYAHQ